MAGKRTQWVLHRYLLEAADGVLLKGVPLTQRLYVPEPFHDERRVAIAERRRSRLAILQAPVGDAPCNLALVLGEFKSAEASPLGRKLWLEHMPQAPLFIDAKTWERIERAYVGLLEARDADTRTRQRVLIAALIYAKREHIYQIDTASLMLTTENWIPLEGVHEADLIAALTEENRRFVKPLRYDARSAAAFPNVLLLDTGAQPTALHVVCAGMPASERAAKEKVAKLGAGAAWVWHTDQPMPPLPIAARFKHDARGRSNVDSNEAFRD